MLNFASTFQLAVPIFSVSNTSNANDGKEACKASIDALAEQVKSGNEDAIGLLINFASGADHSDIRQLAEQSLIDLYMDSTVSDHTKSQIEAQALAFYEATENANDVLTRKDNGAFARHEISAQILYLAGQRAHSLGYTAIADKINESLSPPSLSPPIVARFGCEIEIPGIDVHPAAPRGTVLLTRPLWTLETDDNGPGKSDLEFVFNPLSTESEVQEAMKEIVDLIEAMRQQAVSADMSVRLKDVAQDAKGDYVIKVNDVRFGARLQATYGIRLSDIHQTIDELLSKSQAEKIHRDTDAVAALYQERTDNPLSQDAKAFIELINLYLARAQAKLESDGTVHVYFRMMLRSDFCSVYEQLLSKEDQAAIKTLLACSPGKKIPPLMEALHINNPDHLVFAKPYLLKDRNPDNTQPGPTIKAWLQSIIDGRGEGLFKKDLLSPPKGYPLHSGDLSKDYGMGAMGVDPDSKLVLIEVRGAPYRPEKVAMNWQIWQAVLNELEIAARTNSSLIVSKDGIAASPEFDVLNRCESIYSALARLLLTIKSKPEALNAESGKLMKSFLQKQKDEIALARHTVSTITHSPFIASMKRLESTIDDLTATGADRNSTESVPSHATKVTNFTEALSDFERSLWDAGKKPYIGIH